MLKQLIAITAFVCLLACPLMALAQQQPPSMETVLQNERLDRLRYQNVQGPLTQDQVRDLIKKNKNSQDAIFKAVDERGVAFDLNRDIEKKLRKAGADDIMLQAIWKAGPTNRTAKTASLTSLSGAQLHGTYEEGMGYQTMENALDPDRRLGMVAEFERRFPESQLMSYVYTQAAKAYQQKGDLDKLLEYGEKSLKLDPDNLFSLLMVAITLPQPRMLQGSAVETTQRLSLAETYANRALKLIDSVPSQPNETPEQLQKRKASLASDAHTALAMVDMERDQTEKAAEELKTAISLTEKPSPQLYFRLGEVYANEGKKKEAIEAFAKASELGQGTVLQQYAAERIEALKK